MELTAALLDPGAYPEPTREVALIQTHISWVFITDDFAYKVKKPVDLGFLNFTTLRRRHHYLQEELSLNRRLCPEIYLEVVAVTASRGRVRLGGPGRLLSAGLTYDRFADMREAADQCRVRLEFCRRPLGCRRPRKRRDTKIKRDWRDVLLELTCIDLRVCPDCGGRMVCRQVFGLQRVCRLPP